MIRVFLLDDHALVRTGFRLILSHETDIEIVGEAASGEEGLPAIRKLKPDIVLCDLHLPGVSGLEVTDRIVRGDHGTRVIIVTMQEEGPMPRRLLEAGASGYLGKACPAEELLRAVRDVARGKRYLGSEVAQKMALGAIDGATPFESLSPRELEIATHKTRMFAKLGVQDAIAMSRMASQFGLVEAT